MFSAICWILIFGVLTSSAQTTEFSYQGFLSDNAASANGNFDFEFRLFDAAAGGTALGSIQRPNVAVTNGVFSVVLDFGAFPSVNRFLEVAVKPPGGSVSTTLAPRSKLLSTPYSTNAINAQNANNSNNATNAINAQNAQNAVNATNSQTAQNSLQLGGTPANQYVRLNDPRLNDLRTPLPGSPNYIQNSTSPQNATSFNIIGNGTASGTLSGGVVNAATQYNIGGFAVLRSPGAFNFFAGSGGSLTTGSGNSFFGQFSGTFNTTGSDNSFFGTSAGRSNSTGLDNSYFGRNAGFMNATGNNNAFFGKDAGRDSTGDDNSFFGKGAGLTNSSGDRNAFFGTLSGTLNTVGEDNTFFGSRSGAANTDGTSNTMMGSRAGVANTTGDGNTFVGFTAGETNTTGARITLVGENADVGGADLSNATAIGAKAFVTTNNSLVLGGISGTNGALFDTKVGIGTTAPLDRLHVNGIIRVETLGSAGTTSLCRNLSEQISTCSSSLRYKTAVAPFSSGLNLVNQLKPITFNWKEGGMHDLGLGAEDVEKVEPLLVTYNEKGVVEGVKYDRVAVVLLNAVKEQQTQIEQQRKQLLQQQNLIEGLRKVVCPNNPQAEVCQ